LRQLIAMACTRPPETPEGARQERWTYEQLGAEVGMSGSQAHAILARADIKPHLTEYWTMSDFSKPEFEERCAEICGLYIDPPENVLVVSIDEKTGVDVSETVLSEPIWRAGRIRSVGPVRRCRSCNRLLHGKSPVCRSRKCPEYSHTWAGDQRQKLFRNLEAFSDNVLISAVTAPGADAMPWDECRSPTPERAQRPAVCEGRAQWTEIASGRGCSRGRRSPSPPPAGSFSSRSRSQRGNWTDHGPRTRSSSKRGRC